MSETPDSHADRPATRAEPSRRTVVTRGGLRADLLNTGTLRTGDAITPTEDE
jgi:hypothetical protein